MNLLLGKFPTYRTLQLHPQSPALIRLAHQSAKTDSDPSLVLLVVAVCFYVHWCFG